MTSPAARNAFALLPFFLFLALQPLLPEWAVLWPEEWLPPFMDWINGAAGRGGFLQKEELVAGLTFKDMTRATAKLADYPLDLTYGILVKGFGGAPALPWTTAVLLAAVFGWWVKGPRLALLAGGCILYFALFGKWKGSMTTLSAILVAAFLAGVIGLFLGIAAARSRRLERALVPILNVMQTLPHFSYLIPIVVFVGLSQKAGVIATVIFAIPPMTRLTILGLRGVASEVLEAGRMCGCTPRQMLWKVEIPAARDALMVGVNQVIMQCLAMVVIASFIGTKGLGFDLLLGMRGLKIGTAVEIGVAVVLMAVTIDRLSLALAHKHPARMREGALWQRHPFAAVAIAGSALTFAAAAAFPQALVFPKEWTVTTAAFWDKQILYIIRNFNEELLLFRDAVTVNVLLPMRSAFLWAPWLAFFALVAGIGWRLVGWRRAVLPLFLFMFIAASGFWPGAAGTLYLVTFTVLFCICVGVPLGVLAAASPRRAKAAVLFCDTFQTFPSFVYLIPAIMFFQVSEVSIVLSMVIFGLIPAVRYTVFGLSTVPKETIEAARMAGCTRAQLLWKVRLPLAFPEIMLGVNQTILFSLFMAVIAAFIGGTKHLGPEFFKAMAHSDIGKALILGLCVSCMGLIADRLITGWAAARKQELGLA